MTDLDAAQYILDLKRYNQADKLVTPQNDKFDTFWDCAFDHAIRALEEKYAGKPAQERN